MPKTTEELLASKAGETAESNGFGSQERPLRPSGVYQLKNDDGEVVDELIVKTHPKFGDSQAAAVERVGYKFHRAVKPGEVKQIEVDATQLATEDKAGNVTQDDLKGALARLTLLEKENADLKAGKAAEDSKGTADGDVKAQAKEDAKNEALARTTARAEGVTGGADETARTEELKGNVLDNADESSEDDSSEDEGKEKSFSQLNRAELEAVAEKEGITIPAEADTNAKIREAITKARDEKEKGNQ